MNQNELLTYWKSEEAVAHIHGWDFSHIRDRYTEEADLPWDYEKIVRSYLTPEKRILDIDTGGGEFLLSLGHPTTNTSATEAYPPNVDLCKKTLLPLGVEFKEAGDYCNLPFEDESFDVIINRHGDYDPRELYRLLKPGGIFITDQVGENNDRELVELLLPGTPKPFHGLNLSDQEKAFKEAGFSLERGEEAYRPIRFFDVGALVWFARIIEWEFPDFSVDMCKDRLFEAQNILEKDGEVSGMIHRYLIIAKK